MNVCVYQGIRMKGLGTLSRVACGRLDDTLPRQMVVLHLCVCVCVCKYRYITVCVYTHTTYIHTYIHIHTYICAYIYMYISRYISTYMYIQIQ